MRQPQICCTYIVYPYVGPQTEIKHLFFSVPDTVTDDMFDEHGIFIGSLERFNYLVACVPWNYELNAVHLVNPSYKVTDQGYCRWNLTLDQTDKVIAYRHEHPAVTVDLVQFNSAGTHVLMMKRGPRTQPECYRGLWALPGGHYEKGENPAAAAQRECREETGISPPVDKFKFIAHAYEPDRDPRQWAFGLIYSVIYDVSESTKFTPEDVEESADVAWISVSDIENETIVPAFDHSRWVLEARRQMFICSIYT